MVLHCITDVLINKQQKQGNPEENEVCMCEHFHTPNTQNHISVHLKWNTNTFTYFLSFFLSSFLRMFITCTARSLKTSPLKCRRLILQFGEDVLFHYVLYMHWSIFTCRQTDFNFHHLCNVTFIERIFCGLIQPCKKNLLYNKGSNVKM